MKLKRIMGACLLTGIVVVSLSSCGGYMTFDSYLEQIEPAILGKDCLGWNVFYNDPTSVGYNRKSSVKASWYDYDGLKSESELRRIYISSKYLVRTLHNFNIEDLTTDQQGAYYAIERTFENQAEFYNPANGYNQLFVNDYISYSGGFVSSFASNMVDYNLRNEQDVIDLVDYTSSTKEVFATYLTYAEDRANEGCPLSDYCLNKMISYLDDITASGRNFYLYKVYENKINSTTFLTDSQKESYLSSITTALDDCFMPAVKSLSEGIAGYRGKATQEGYLRLTDEGKKQYEFEYRNKLGYSSVDLDAEEKYLKEKFEYYNGELEKVKSEIEALKDTNEALYLEAKSYSNDKASIIGTTDENEIIKYLKEFAKTVVPDLETDPNVTVKYMDVNYAKVSKAMAYYRASAFDDKSANEYITLNQLQISGPNTLLATLAHEGYPGHLYQHVYAKQNGISNIKRLLSNLGYMEGWAMYVEDELFDYIADNSDSEAVKLGAKYLKYYNITGYARSAYIDIMANYEGYSKNDLVNSGLCTEKNVDFNFYRSVEDPGVMIPYGYGILKLIDLHEEVKNSVSNYDVVDYNKAICTEGVCGLERLESITKTYINFKK